MTLSSRSKMSVIITVVAFLTIIGGVLASVELRGTIPYAHAKAAGDQHTYLDCTKKKLCLDVAHSEDAFGEGHYVGHDEPINTFYSNVPGAGNRNLWLLRLPSDPASNPDGTPKVGQSFNFELHPAFWFGMTMCDTQSYPELVSTCTPDSDSNIVDPAVSPNHPGTAFMEMQFYPPGWAPFELPGGISCDAKQWCAALNIDSLSLNPVTGQTLNVACQAITGEEYVNFAFITHNGVAQAPANPVQATTATFTPDRTQDLFMNSGDNLIVAMHDTPIGLRIDIVDLTTRQHGSMTASAANGFGQVQFAPDPSTACNNIPSNFHPMYSTSSEKTTVTWSDGTANTSFSDEIGHFDFCTDVVSGGCTGQEGIPGDQENTDGDDNFCLLASASTFIQVAGCTDTNAGFDGVPYQKLWPNGNPDHPTPIQFSSPLTGLGYTTSYSRSAFEADLPSIESTCDITTGAGCTLIPQTDDGTAAPFYPYYSTTNTTLKLGPGFAIPLCVWQFGDQIPGSISDFGQNAQFGTLFPQAQTVVGGTAAQFFLAFHKTLNQNPCQPTALGFVANQILGEFGGGGA